LWPQQQRKGKKEKKVCETMKGKRENREPEKQVSKLQGMNLSAALGTEREKEKLRLKVVGCDWRGWCLWIVQLMEKFPLIIIDSSPLFSIYSDIIRYLGKSTFSFSFSFFLFYFWALSYFLIWMLKK